MASALNLSSMLMTQLFITVSIVSLIISIKSDWRLMSTGEKYDLLTPPKQKYTQLFI